jgi:hypothetical protein
MAHSTRQPHTLDADAGQLIRYLQRGGTKSNLQTFKPTHVTWYDTNAPAPALPTGTSVYFGVSPCTAIPPTNAVGELAPASAIRSQVDYIAALNCLYADFDAKDFGGSLDETLAHVRGLAVQPSVIVASGGGYHCYWLLDEPFVLDTDEKRQHAVDVQARWTTFVRGDKAAKDIARVLRVPGTLNYKYEPARPVTFVEQDYSRTYTLDALQAMLPAVAPRTARTPRTNAPACHTDALPPGVAQPSVDLMAISKAAAALAQLSTARRDEYTGWLQVGMALRELGDAGLQLWQWWAEASQKYNVGDCQDKWPTFRIGTPGGTEITLASLYRYADEDGEPVSTLDEAERRQLQDLQARDVQQQRILTMKAPLAAKAIWLGMLPTLEAKQALMANNENHTGSLAVNYGNFAEKMNTNKKAVGNAVELGERAGLWRKDAEYKETNANFDIKLIRLDLQPAFFRPELAEAIPETRGGKRAGAGRKPKCANCPPNTPMRETTETTIKTYCMGCGECLDEVTTYKTRELMPDDAPVDAPAANVETNADEFKFEYADETPTRQAEHADEFKIETVYTTGTTPVSVLKKTRAELVPVALTETFDITAAIRLADTYAPVDATECRHYKTSLVWTQRGEHEKAAALAANVHDERAHAILLHLAERTAAIAPGLRE